MSVSTVPIVSRIVQKATDILARDRARAQKLLSGLHSCGPLAFRQKDYRLSSSAKESIHVIDSGVTYTTTVGIGSPPQNFTLLIDTGSSNTWVGAGTLKYQLSSTGKNTGKQVNVSYGSGSFSGTEFIETVTLGPGLVIPQQSIGVASTAQGFGDGIDGILGIGPVDLTQGTVDSNSVPTVLDNLYSAGLIPTESIGISYEPTLGTEKTANGELTFGTVDHSKYIGDIEYVPITSTSPASRYWGIDQSITYGDGIPILPSSPGIVDTGTTLLLLASDAFKAYQQATGATMDNTTGLLTITQEQYDKLEGLHFHIGNTTFELTPNAQIWPRALNATLGGDPDKIYLVAGDNGTNSGSGLDFINGFAFLQRFYSIYDVTNNQVGIARTPFTDADTN